MTSIWASPATVRAVRCAPKGVRGCVRAIFMAQGNGRSWARVADGISNERSWSVACHFDGHAGGLWRFGARRWRRSVLYHDGGQPKLQVRPAGNEV